MLSFYHYIEQVSYKYELGTVPLRNIQIQTTYVGKKWFFWLCRINYCNN